jgi:hypothetical protein
MASQFASINSLLKKASNLKSAQNKISRKTDEAALQAVIEVEELNTAIGGMLAECRNIHTLQKSEEGLLMPEALQAQLDSIGEIMSAMNKAKAERMKSSLYIRGLSVRDRYVAEQAARAEAEAKQREAMAKEEQTRKLIAAQNRAMLPQKLIREIFSWRYNLHTAFMDLSKMANTNVDGQSLKGAERNAVIANAVPKFLKRFLDVPADFSPSEWETVINEVSDFMVKGAIAMRTSYYNQMHDLPDPKWDKNWNVIREQKKVSKPSNKPVAHQAKPNKTVSKAVAVRAQHEEEKPEFDNSDNAEFLRLFSQ